MLVGSGVYARNPGHLKPSLLKLQSYDLVVAPTLQQLEQYFVV